MKRLIAIFLIGYLSSANALTWSQLKSWGNKTIDPDVKYNLETEGYNVRVYEFTPLSDPGSTCVISFTNEKMGMFCFNKSKHAIKK
jgi:hypothetical protein